MKYMLKDVQYQHYFKSSYHITLAHQINVLDICMLENHSLRQYILIFGSIMVYVALAEWLRRQIRNLLGSPAQVQILQATFFKKRG